MVVGRICCDIEASSSKLTEDNIVIESSRMMGSGSRVPLRFSPAVNLRGMPQGMTGAGFFPGAIVALKGRNGGGNAFVVSEILGVRWSFALLLLRLFTYFIQLPRSPLSSDPVTHKGFKMVAACGPYTTDSNLDYQPFRSLLEKLSQLKPSVVLLVRFWLTL